ncbi:hypothetical protein B0H14DRAFT_224069 [Mycena olivaceomarginata]|nr:hypothetical protein B0H14DRAFT_224069 [Mycena olivaceomarginata]
MPLNITTSTADREASCPSMPNSDLFTLSFASDAKTNSPITRGRTSNIQTQRWGAPLRPSPLGRFPALTPTSTTTTTVLPFLKHQLLSELDTPVFTDQSPSRGAIGLGHPSNSKRRCAPLGPRTAACLSQVASTNTVRQSRGRATIGLGHPSTSKRRCAPLESEETYPSTSSSMVRPHSMCFPRPVTTTSQRNATVSRPVLGARKRSYAQATRAGCIMSSRTSRCVASATPTFRLGAPRCASEPLGGTQNVLTITALASQYTSSGALQAGLVRRVSSPSMGRC